MKPLTFFPLLAALAWAVLPAPAARAQAPAPAPVATPPVVPVDATGWTTPRPPYPEAAQRAKHEGAVRVRVFTDRKGNVRSAKVVQSSGFAELDDATVKFALSDWHGPPLSRAVYLQNFSLKRR